jgi:predicted nucleic acid-binding protein
MRVLLDTDVILDVIAARLPFTAEAGELLDLSEEGAFEAYISALTPLNVFYIARKAKSSTNLRESNKALLQVVKMCPLNDAVLDAAFALPFSDYEDAVQHCCATAAGLEAIVTRNVRDYKNSTLPVFTPAEFLDKLKSQQT